MPFGSNNEVHVANDYGPDVYVLASPNKDWALAELLTDASLILTPVGEISAAARLAELPKTIKTVSDLHQYLEVASKLGNGAFAKGTKAAEELTALVDKFKQNSTRIPRGSAPNVCDQDSANMYLTASGWGGIFGASTVTLTILSDSTTLHSEKSVEGVSVVESKAVGPKCAQFNTGPDDSWIATFSGIVRAKYGHLWVPDPESGSHSW